MKVFTSEVEMLRAECKEWEKVCEQHLRHIKKLKKKRAWSGLTEDEAIDLLPAGDWEIESTLEFFKAVEAKLKEKNQ